MKNSSVVFFTDRKNKYAQLVEMLEVNTDLTVCSYSPDSWDNVDFYSNKNICFVIDEMPQDKSAVWIISKLSEDGLFAEVPVLFTSYDAMYEFDKSGFASFAYDVLPEPFEYEIAYRRLMNIAEIRQLKSQIHNLTQIHTKRILNQANKLKEQNAKMQSMNYDLVELLVAAIESRDLESGQHIKRIRYFTKALTDAVMELYPEYGITKEQAEYIYYASSVHDIGKIAIPDAIMLKPGRLTPEEFEIMKTHTTRGYELLNLLDGISDRNEYFKYCQEICHYHHERWDGRGYPEGLKGDETPISAQIVAVCDCYDALTSNRPYKTALSHHDAVDLIMNGACGCFSPQIIKAFDFVLNDFARIEKEFKSKPVDAETLKRAEYVVKTAAEPTKTVDSKNLSEGEQRILSSHDIVFEADLKNGYFSVLRGEWVGIFPYVPKNFTEVISQCLKYCHPADAARFASKVNIAAFEELCKLGKKKTRVEFRLVKDGAEYLAVGVIVFVPDKDKNLVALNGVFNIYDDEDILSDIKRGFGVTDPLTGLLQQKQFEHDVNSYLKDNINSKNLLIHIDIDNMSLCNNIFGYEYGNTLIKEFASILKSVTAKDKILCKAASDKFLLFVKNITNQAEIIVFIENLHNILRKPYTTAKENGVFTATMGISRYPNDGDDFKSLSIASEYAAKIAKTNGSGTYAFFNSTMQNFANYGSDDSSMKHGGEKDNDPRFIPVVDAKTHELVCYDYIPYPVYDSNSFLAPEAYYEFSKKSANSKNVGLLSMKSLLYMLIRYKKSGKKIPPVSIYTTLTAEDLPGFINEMTSMTKENDCDGIDLCIMLPQDILEELHLNRIKSVCDYVHSLGFKIGLYLLGSRYIHNYCHTRNLFDRYVMKSEYVEHSINASSHIQYCVDTLNVLLHFVDDVTIPSIVDPSDSKLMFDAGVNSFSHNEPAISGGRGLIDDFALRTLSKTSAVSKNRQVSELNPAIAYHDIVNSDLIWFFYDIQKKSFSISSNAESVLGIDIFTSNNKLTVENIMKKIHPEDLALFNEKLSMLKMNLGVVSFDLRYDADGTGCYDTYCVTLLCAVDDGGVPLRYQCSVVKLQ